MLSHGQRMSAKCSAKTYLEEQACEEERAEEAAVPLRGCICSANVKKIAVDTEKNRMLHEQSVSRL